jgi:uncharacterized membrane protein
MIATLRVGVAAGVNLTARVWSVTRNILRRLRRQKSRDHSQEKQLRRRYAFGSIDRETFERGLRYLRRGRGRPWHGPQSSDPP